jgi:hypothetical protein
MHGVPENLDLSWLVGTTLVEIGVSPHHLQLHFTGDPWGGAGRVSVQGGYWELRTSDGTLVDWTQEPFERDCLRVHKIIGYDVSGFTVDAPKSFTLHFTSNHDFIAFDDSPYYESFSIHLPGQPDLYV